MSREHKKAGRWSPIFSVAALLAICSANISHADTVTARAGATWRVGHDSEDANACVNQPAGSYTLGENLAIAGSQADIKKQVSGSYASTGANFLDAFKAETVPTGGSTTSQAISFVNVAATGPGGQFCFLLYDIGAVAIVNVFGDGPRGFAFATATDPQSINTPGFVFATIGLEPGSGVFSSGHPGNAAMTTFSLSASPLTEPLASIQLNYTGSALEATVEFNADPNLGFFHPVTLAPLTAQDVETVLESNSELATEGGLTTALDLFFYEYDIPFVVPGTSAFFGSRVESTAGTIPEPSSLTLAVLAVLALFGMLALPR